MWTTYNLYISPCFSDKNILITLGRIFNICSNPDVCLIRVAYSSVCSSRKFPTQVWFNFKMAALTGKKCQHFIHLWPPGELCPARHWCPRRPHSDTDQSRWNVALTAQDWHCSGSHCNQAALHDPGRPSSPVGWKWERETSWTPPSHSHFSKSLTPIHSLYCTLTTLSLATRTDCSFCRPSEPLWPQTLVHLILGGSWDELALGRRVKRQGRRTVLDSSSLMVWWVTFRIFTTVSALVTPDKTRGGERRGEDNQCRIVNEATGRYFSLRWKGVS